MTDFTNVQPPDFAPREPLYPPLIELVRVPTVAASPAAALLQQWAGGSTFRDRISVYLCDPTGANLTVGYHLARLVGSYNSLPLYVMTCCVATGVVTGTGTPGTVPIWTGVSVLGDSPIIVSGSTITLGSATTTVVNIGTYFNFNASTNLLTINCPTGGKIEITETGGGTGLILTSDTTSLATGIYEASTSVGLTTIVPATSVVTCGDGATTINLGTATTTVTTISGGLVVIEPTKTTIIKPLILTSTTTPTLSNSQVGLFIDDTPGTAGLYAVVKDSAGGSSTVGLVGGGGQTLWNRFDDVTNGGATAETTLYTNAMTGNTLGANGDNLSVECSGTGGGAGSFTYTVRFYFDTTIETLTFTTANPFHFSFDVWVIRETSGLARYQARAYCCEDGAQVYLAATTSTGSLAVDLTASVTVKATVQVSGTVNLVSMVMGKAIVEKAA